MQSQTLDRTMWAAGRARSAVRGAGFAAAGLAVLIVAACTLDPSALAQAQATPPNGTPQSSTRQNAKAPAQQPSSGPIVMGEDPDSTPDSANPSATPAAQPALAPRSSTNAPAATAPSQPAAAPVAPAAVAAAAVPVPANAGGDAGRQLINDECANLLKMANDLKAAVDKTTKDMLSVAVVRKANDIETLAHRVKDEMKPEVGKN